ncbi:MAG: hypothetical protein R8M11_09030 [Gallionella sp.]
MFDSTELGHLMDKAIYNAEVPTLRAELLNISVQSGQKCLISGHHSDWG